jgi:hypothetical protein|tara:strand:- start:2053 stop:2175 length:123 start_codon:yes stop_codon:yes gene_type:complete
MPQGEGTYGDKVGRPPKKKKKEEDSSEGSSILTSKPKKDY